MGRVSHCGCDTQGHGAYVITPGPSAFLSVEFPRSPYAGNGICENGQMDNSRPSAKKVLCSTSATQDKARFPRIITLGNSSIAPILTNKDTTFCMWVSEKATSETVRKV